MNLVEERTKPEAKKRLLNKVALVTGGARGIGAAIALRLAEEGAKVAITYAKSEKAAAGIVEQASQFGVEAVAYKAQADSLKDIQHLIQQIEKEFGKIDILVNNAGVYANAPLGQMDGQHFESVFNVNVKGVIDTTNAALKLIPEGGRIINISSTAARASFPGFSVYSASKAALDTLTRIWAQELGSKKITVNGVAPGATQTDMYEAAMNDEAKDMVIGKTALGRVGQPDDIAAAVAFLASDDGRWVTGQTIAADGGFNA